MFKIESLTIVMLIASFALKKHPLMILLSLEILILSMVLLFFLLGLDLFFLLLLLSVGACEGAIGLGALVSLKRTSSTIHV